MPYASRESVAYTLETSEEELDVSRFKEQSQREVQKIKRVVHKIRLVTPLRILTTVALSVLAVVMISGQMKLMQLTRDISARETTIQEMQSEAVSLKSRQEQMLSAEYIEAYAIFLMTPSPQET